MAGFLGLKRRDRHERVGFELYAQAVKAARDPFLYLECGVPDTLDGRFDLIGLHVFLLINRLSRDSEPGPAVAQAVFDAMFSDMDINLRELGVGDLSVGRRVRAMWEAFHGRSLAYTTALDANDAAALRDALIRNVWREAAPAGNGPDRLVRHTLAQATALAGQPLADLIAGRVSFVPAQQAAA